MAAPATDLARVNPSTVGGRFLEDGFTTKIIFEANLAVLLWDLTVTPPGIDGGDAIDITNMFNTKWKTKAPRQLIELMDSDFTAQYEPGSYTDCIALVNVRTTINMQFSDGSVLGFFGYLRTFEPQSHEEGSNPTANCSFTGTNWDHINWVEAAPALSNVPGT